MEITLNLSKKQLKEMMSELDTVDIIKMIGDNEVTMEALAEVMKPDDLIAAILPHISPEDMIKAMLEDDADSVIAAVMAHGREKLDEALAEEEA